MRAARDKAPASARAVGVRMLARRDYSRAEFAQRLRARGLPAADIEAALDDFERRGYLCDARYAQALVGARAGRLGSRAIARDLHDKGIAPAAAKDALSALADRDELADATALWQRRFGRPPVDDRERVKQVRFLIARGYGVSIALKVVDGVSESLRPQSTESTGES
jgi:regulatory protein